MLALLNGGTTTIIDTVIAEVPSVVTLMTSMLTNLISNPFFAFLFAAGFARMGMSLIRKAKKASR